MDHDWIENGDFSTMRKLGLFVDSNIVCKGEHFGIHKLILTTYSDYFGETFLKLDSLSRQTSVQQGKISIVIDDVEPVDVENVLSYMYDGEVRVQEEDVDGFLEACRHFKLDNLKTLVEQTEGLLKNRGNRNRNNWSGNQGKTQAQKKVPVVQSLVAQAGPSGTGSSLTFRRKKRAVKSKSSELISDSDEEDQEEYLSTIRPGTGQIQGTNTIETVDFDLTDATCPSSLGLGYDGNFKDVERIGHKRKNLAAEAPLSPLKTKMPKAAKTNSRSIKL